MQKGIRKMNNQDFKKLLRENIEARKAKELKEGKIKDFFNKIMPSSKKTKATPNTMEKDVKSEISTGNAELDVVVATLMTIDTLKGFNRAYREAIELGVSGIPPRSLEAKIKKVVHPRGDPDLGPRDASDFLPAFGAGDEIDIKIKNNLGELVGNEQRERIDSQFNNQ